MTLATGTPSAHNNAPVIPGYAVVPNAILREASLSLAARLLYGVLDGRRASGAWVRVGAETLAADLGTSVSTVSRAAKELEAAGWLERRRTGRTSAWRLANPIRTPKRMASLERVLDAPQEGGTQVSTLPPEIGHQRTRALTDSAGGTVEGSNALSRGPRGPGRAGLSGPSPESLREVRNEASDLSPVTVLQRSTREDYKQHTGAAAPLGAASAGDGGTSRAQAGHVPSPEAVGGGSTIEGCQTPVADESGRGGATIQSCQTPATTNDPVMRRYLSAINAATGADLRPTRTLRETIRKISARGIPADEAAMTAAAWLAVKAGKVHTVEGFLAAVALPSMGAGQEPDLEPPRPTPMPPAYRQSLEAPRCSHGAEEGRCALCRREAGGPPEWFTEETLAKPEAEIIEDANPALTAALAKLTATRQGGSRA